MTTAIGWVRATALPDRAGVRIGFADLMEFELGMEDAELLACDVVMAMGTVFARAGRWGDFVRWMDQLAFVARTEPGLRCDPDAG